MSPTIDTSLAPLVGLLALVIGIALYVWMALALAALFRKMGEESWKGWVPLLNQATVLKWGGFNPWLVLLILLPGPGTLALTILLVIAAHRINPGFGYGAGMTVLAALLFVVWASILGFGPAPWRGARQSTAPLIPPLPPLPPAPAGFAAAPVGAPVGLPAAPVPPRAAFTAADPLAARPVTPQSATPQPTTRQPGAPASWAPPIPPRPAPPVPVDAEPDIASWPSEIDDVSAVSPSPFPPSAAAPSAARHATTPIEPAADGLISFVPGRRAAEPEPVTRTPVTSPIETPLPSRAGEAADAEGFPELSGEVSAVVGSPAAGAPLSALSSVSAQQRVQQEPVDVDVDDIDQTVMVRRKRISWQLIPASGAAIPLAADVVVLGRRPLADPAFPQAQLVAVTDEARTVSKTHARIELRGERWLVTDLGSTNGVLVRTLMGEEIEVEPGTELEAGERFFLGDEEFHLQHD